MAVALCVVVCLETPLMYAPNRRVFDCQSVESVARRVQTHVRGVSEHLARDVPCNRHDRLVAGLGLGKLRDRLMTEVMETEARKRTLEFCNIHRAAHTRLAGILQQTALGAA
jgi:hypothetical protein